MTVSKDEQAAELTGCSVGAVTVEVAALATVGAGVAVTGVAATATAGAEAGAAGTAAPANPIVRITLVSIRTEISSAAVARWDMSRATGTHYLKESIWAI